MAGVGGAGVNATALIQDDSAPGLETVAIDTDGQTLVTAQPRVRIELGDGTGGAGGDPAVGAAAAEAAVEQLRSTFSGADVVFVLAGLGGGTGSGAAPVCAQAARDGGALVFGIAIRPFRFEGPRRATYADEAAARMGESADATLVLANNELLQLGPQTSLMTSFGQTNARIAQLIGRICSMLIEPGVVNVDMRDLRRVASSAGPSLVGTGQGASATEATDAAVASAKRQSSEHDALGQADRLLVHFRARELPPLPDMEQAITLAQEACGGDADVVWGVTAAEDGAQQVSVLLIAAFGPGAGAGNRDFGGGMVHGDADDDADDDDEGAAPDEAEAEPVAAEAEPVAADEPVADEAEAEPVTADEAEPAAGLAPEPAAPQPGSVIDAAHGGPSDLRGFLAGMPPEDEGGEDSSRGGSVQRGGRRS